MAHFVVISSDVKCVNLCHILLLFCHDGVKRHKFDTREMIAFPVFHRCIVSFIGSLSTNQNSELFVAFFIYSIF